MEGIAVGTAVAIEVGEGVMEVGDGVTGVGEGVMGGDSVALGVGFDGGITSTSLSIVLVDFAPFRFVVTISTWAR